jgi:rhomboid protease GluP
MSLSIAVAASNGITITSSMICCVAYLYKYRWRHLKPRTLVASTLIIALTVLIFGLQAAFPEILQAFRLDVDGLKAGEWWRLVSPLFVQPYGPYQFLFNMMFLVVFLPMAERIYGARVWLLYLLPGVVGQLVNCAWRPGGGGSSTAAFGVMGSILIYVLLDRKSAPRQYPVFAILGLCGAVAMCFTRDGHGPGLLTGAVLAGLICWLSPPEQPKSATIGV